MEHKEKHIDDKKYISILEEVLDSLPVGIVVFDRTRTVIATNPKANEILGEIKTGMPASKIFSNISAQNEENENQDPTRSGQLRKIAIDSAQTPAGLEVITVQDITQEAVQANKAAQSARLQELGTASARLAHQIRTPLASALLNTSLAKKRSNDQLTIASLDKTLNQIRLIETRVNNLMRFIKGNDHNNENCIAGEACEEAVKTIEPITTEKGISINISRIDNCSIKACSDDLVFAMLAAIENSIEANARNIDISIIKSNGLATITVSDDGTGITIDGLNPKPFKTTKQHGTGIGLQIVKKTFEAAGGSISLTRVDGKTLLTCKAQEIS
mgnify:CR=1 FL=1